MSDIELIEGVNTESKELDRMLANARKENDMQKPQHKTTRKNRHSCSIILWLFRLIVRE